MLQEKPEIAEGFSKIPKEEVNSFWEAVKIELNSLGPPSKDTSSWRKVWLDWKAYIKRKMVENKKKCKATGGGGNRMHSFSSLEEGVIRLTGLETSPRGIKDTQSFGFKNSSEPLESNERCEENQLADVSMSSDVVDVRNVPRRLPTTSRQSYDSSSLLKEQVKMQQEFHAKTEEFRDKKEKSSEGISSSLRRIYRGIEKLSEIEEKRLEESKRHNQVKEKLLQRKIEIKMKMVQIHEERYSPE